MSRPKGMFRPHVAANRVFVNRHEPLALLHGRLAELSAASSELLVFYGVGGQGKTSLCREFQRRLKERADDHVKVALVDLHGRTDIDHRLGLLWIRNAIAASRGASFPAFDLGFALYWSLTNPEQATPVFEGTQWLASAEGVAADAAGAAGEAAITELLQLGLESVPVVGKVLERLASWGIKKARRQYTIRTNDAVQRLFGPDGQPLHFTEIARQLPVLLASDLEEAVQRTPGLRFVILVDELERVFEQGGVGSRLHSNPFSEGLRDLVAVCNACLFVFFSRERLPWSYQPPAGVHPDTWQQWIDGAHHLLGGLSRADADRFLQLVPVPDEATREAIIDGSGLTATASGEGVYPLMLDLQVDIYLANLVDGKLAVPIDSLRTPASSFEELRRKLLMRLLRDYGPATESVLTRLAVARSFDRSLFVELVRAFGIGFAIEHFRWITDLSFVNPAQQKGEFTILRAVRDCLVEFLPPDDRKETHLRLADYFLRQAPVEEAAGWDQAQLRHFSAAVHHRVEADLLEAAQWWRSVRATVFDRLEVGALLPIERIVIDALVAPDEEHQALRAEILGAHGQELRVAGRLDEALEAMAEGVDLGRRLGAGFEATLLLLQLRYAQTLVTANRLLEAEFLTDEIAASTQRLGESDAAWMNAATLDVIASGLEGQGLFAKAESFRARRWELLRESEGDAPGYGVYRAQVDLIANRFEQGHVAEAEQQILALDEALTGSALSPLDKAVLRNNMVRIVLAGGNEAAARRLAQQALVALQGVDKGDNPLEQRMLLGTRSSLASIAQQSELALRTADEQLRFVEDSPAHDDEDLLSPMLDSVQVSLEQGDAPAAAAMLQRFSEMAAQTGPLPVPLQQRALVLQMQQISIAADLPARVQAGEMPDPALGAQLFQLAMLVNQLGGARLLLDVYQADLATLVARCGADHPAVAVMEAAVALQHLLCAEVALAKRAAGSALPKLKAAHGPDSPMLVAPLQVLATPDGETPLDDLLAYQQEMLRLVRDSQPPLDPMSLMRCADTTMVVRLVRGEHEAGASELELLGDTLKQRMAEYPAQADELLRILSLARDVIEISSYLREPVEADADLAQRAASVWGADHLMTSLAQQASARWREQQGDLDAAVELRMQAAATAHGKLGSEASPVRDLVAEVGETLMNAGRVAAARPWLNKAIQGVDPGQHDPAWWAKPMALAAQASDLCGDAAQAQHLANQVLAQAQGPEQLEERLDCLRLLAGQAIDAQDWDGLRALCQRLQGEADPLPEGAFGRIRIGLSLGYAFGALRETALARQAVAEASASAATHWPNVDWVGHEANLYAWWASAVGGEREALAGVTTDDIASCLSALRLSVGGDNHKYGARLLRAAQVLRAMGEAERAVAMTRESMQRLEAACGELHPLLPQARALLAEAANEAR